MELGEYSHNMLSEAFWTPNAASTQSDEYYELGFAKIQTQKDSKERLSIMIRSHTMQILVKSPSSILKTTLKQQLNV